MKHKLHLFPAGRSPDGLLKYLFRPGGQLIIVLLLFYSIAKAQEQPPTEFPVGSTFGSGNRTTEALYDSYFEAGMNMIEQYANEETRPYIEDYNLNALNMDREQDWIYFYSSSFYSKWQAEEEDIDTPYVGVKHKFGKKAEWGNASCWSTIDVTSPGDSLLFGPHYHQEKWYRRWLYAKADTSKMNGIYDVRYIPRWRMALDTTNSNIDPNEDVCKLSVWIRHAPEINGVWNQLVYDHLLKESQILKVSDFPANGQFDYFYLDNDTTWYQYPEEYQNPEEYYKLKYPDIPDISDTVWVDTYGNNGVEFRVEWLRSDAKCTLYVDFVEIYDEYGWKDYIDNPEITAYKITSYADSFETMQWTNIKRWIGATEPYTIDSYIPIRTVDSLLRENGSPPLMVQVYPYWDVKVNEDSQLVRYYKTVKPDPLAIHFFPFNSWNVPSSYGDWEAYRTQLQISYSLTGDKGFWYQAQNFGFELPGGGWLGYRQPDSSEHKAEIMLALAHGIKGLVFAHYDSYPQTGYMLQGLIKDDPPYYTKTDLWYMIKDNIVPRLKGKLGKTLMDSLNYTGNYLQLQHIVNQQNPYPATYDYLTLELVNPSIGDHNWHAGFFSRAQHALDEYFMLDNLITTDERDIKVTIDPPHIEDYPNYRFRNIEGVFDTTIHLNPLTMQLEYTPGEGYLYEVAPVVLYGGRLLYPENAGEGQVLTDDMIIEDGATLTIHDTYTANANIIVKNGSIVNGENGTIIFNNGSKLIIEGIATINGTPGDKLSLSFNGEDTQNGIIVDSDGSLIMSDCIVEGAETGLKALVDAGNINIQNVDFNDCIASSINILGQTVGSEAVRKIKYCTITNSPTGISASNVPELLIQENVITNTDLGINLSNVSRAIVFGNNITSNTESLPAIFAESTGGEIHSNIISGHTNGLQIGNSSIDVGGNDITGCLYHAMYAGSGSEINMRGRLIQNPNNHLWYAISGYNSFYNNGGYDGGGSDNDGSEIYINENANVTMSDGCNSIVDDREPSGGLLNTLLLMNGDNVNPPIHVEAQYNYWGETEVTAERFGDLDVNFDEYQQYPCPLPDGGSGEMLIMQTSSGEAVDTLYPSGEATGTLSETEMLYAAAEKSFITGDYAAAENYYDQVIAVDTLLSVKKEAHVRKYEIGRLLGKGTAYFNDLRNAYLSLAQSSSNPLLVKTFYQLSTLCLIGEEEYVPAIGEFDAIIQQNPNTEEAVYAEIDAITTAILIEESDTTLQKGTLGKYLIKSGEDYLSKLDVILRKHFGSGKKETEEVALPTEYTLYQNYPNPFNPITTINYDLPNTSDISLIIYDILGRKVKELVNKKQQAGRYEIQFDASSLASGVYLYQIIAKDFISTKKMILLK